MTGGKRECSGRLPAPARWLLRISSIPRETRNEVQADLIELFLLRRRDHGAIHAHRRLYLDVASLWLQRGPAVSSTTFGIRRSALDRSPSALLRDVGLDLRYAVRLFARQPAILLLTIVGLSLGLGIATASFSIMNAALRGEGIVDSDRLPGVLRTTDRSQATVWTYDEFLRLREGATRMRVEAVMTDGAAARTKSSEIAVPSAGVGFVSGGFFAATGGRTLLGRPLEAADEQHIGPAPVVVSFVFWTSRLDRDPAVIGRTIRVGRTAATIVGVAERGFSAPHNRLLWTPLTAYGAVYDAAPTRRTPDVGVEVFGRLLPDATISEAEAQLSGVAASLPRDATAGGASLRVRLDPGAGLGRVSSADALAITLFVFAVIGLVLLLACANVATVLIATAITREREMGVRKALGASRWRIVRQLVTESVALGSIAAGIGLLLAWWTIPLIGTLVEAPAGVDLAPDFRVYLFLAIVTLVSGVAAGLAPAWHGRGADLVTPLKGEGAGQNRVAPRRFRSMLVMTQAAASVMLIVTATLFVRATFRAATVDVGFDAGGLYAVTPGLGRDSLANDGAGIRRFWARAISELQAVPGMGMVTLTELTPFSDLTKSSVTTDGLRVVYFNRTGAEYFETLGLRTVTGRLYTRGEVASKAPVAVISESLARAYWPDQSPLGELLPQQIPVAETRPQVIGVVADAITARLHERNTFAVYEPPHPASEVFAELLVRVAPGSDGAIDQARQRLRSLDAEADVKVVSVAARLQQEAGRPRMLASLTGVIGIIGIVLCVIGLYGLTASVVAQRAREMAVRAAMGAEPVALLRLMMWDSLRPVVLGLALGGGAALLASRVVIAAMFFGVSPRDPMAFIAAAVILLGAAILAIVIPTRRAAAIDAALVLRQS